MKFYKRFPGDIMKKTSGLTMAQFGAYDRLIDWCYANEKPVDPEEVYTITHAQTPADRRDVDRVLSKFFTLVPGGWVDVEEQRKLAASKRANARQHWAARLPREIKTAIEAARRTRKQHAMPKWLTREDLALIDEIYREARLRSEESGEPHQVDHVVPLNGKTVCGLHVPWNLEVKTALANRLKGNLLLGGGT